MCEMGNSDLLGHTPCEALSRHGGSGMVAYCLYFALVAIHCIAHHSSS